MSRWFSAVLVLLLGGLNLAPAANPSPAPATRPIRAAFPMVPADPDALARFDQLLAQLNHDDWTVRQKAQDELVLLGDAIRERLQASLRSAPNEEVRTRLEAALAQIAERALVGPSIVTIRMKGAHPKEVFAELARQAGAQLRPNPTNLWESREWPKVDLDIDQQPFWQAMREICSKVGVSPQTSGRERDMVIMDRNASGRPFGEAPAVVAGPFLIVANYINRSHYVDLNQPANVRRTATIQLSVYAEPKIRVVQAAYAPDVEECVDARGNDLAMPRNAAVTLHMQPPSGGWMWNMSVSLQPKADTGDRIARLKAATRFMMQTKSETVEVDNVMAASNVTRTIGGRKFLLKDIKKIGDNNYATQLTVYKAGWSAQEWTMAYAWNTFRLVDAEGNDLSRVGVSQTSAGADQMNVTLQFQRLNWAGQREAGEPAKLVWEVPTQTREVEIPFEFKDIPLP